MTCLFFNVAIFPYLNKVNDLLLSFGLGERDDDSLDADLSVRKT